MRRLLLAALALPALLGLAGCFGTSPPSRFYVLSGNPGEPGVSTGAAPSGILGVMPARVAAYLDRPQIVTFDGQNGLVLDEFNRWAEPLSAGVARVMALDLAALLPGWRVLPQPWDPTVPLRLQLVVQVDAFGWDTAGEARLDASWALLTSYAQPAVARGRTRVTRKLPRPNVDAGVATASALLEEMSREIAAAVRAAPAP